MRRISFPLGLKIMIWFLLNLIVLTAVFGVIFSINFRLDRGSQFFFAPNRLEVLSRQLTNETQGKSREERDAILARQSEASGVSLYVFGDDGRQLAGPPTQLPEEIARRMTQFRPPFPARENGGPDAPPAGPDGPPRPVDLGPRPLMPGFYTYTSNPTLYWSAAPTFVFDKDSPTPVRARLIASSESITGHGLFFNPAPWLATIGIVLVVSALVWFPFVRSLKRDIAELDSAARKIANEDFAVRVAAGRRDELGRLGASVNHLASRLEGFVSGQKRFLSDISHELNTPLARMQFALGILESKVAEKDLAAVEDVREEVQVMTRLVSELLAFSKTGMQAREVELERCELRPLIEHAVERETATGNAEVVIDVETGLEATVHAEMFSRAVANIVRNAVRYAGEAGPIAVNARMADDGSVEVTVSDSGDGVPEDAVEKLFDPFFRVETHRSRESGGTGLGLAIVRTCAEACRGRVAARNLSPKGFAVTITLPGKA